MTDQPPPSESETEPSVERRIEAPAINVSRQDSDTVLVEVEGVFKLELQNMVAVALGISLITNATEDL